MPPCTPVAGAAVADGGTGIVWVCPGAEALVLPEVLVPPRALPFAGDEDALPLTGFGQTLTLTHFLPRRRRTVLHFGLGFGFFNDLTDPELVPTGAVSAEGAAHARQPQAATALNVRASRCALRPRRE